jgi:hypothetical protein
LADAIADTVVLLYFLLAGEHELLLRLLGTPLHVPRLVFDPDEEPDTPPPAMSEIARATDYHRRVTGDPSRPQASREAAAAGADRLQAASALHRRGDLDIVDMTDTERGRFAALTSPERVGEFDLRFPVDPGEAACVAIALERKWTIATDDNDALKALRAISSRHPYERIRKLLIRAAEEGHIMRGQANEIHAMMTNLGFWDQQLPFPHT